MYILQGCIGNHRVDFEKRLCCFFPSYSPPQRANRPVLQRRHYLIIIICTQKYSTGFTSAWTWSKPVATRYTAPGSVWQWRSSFSLFLFP